MMACAAPGQAAAVNALAKRYVVVNAMIRLAGISFCRTQGGPQNRELRTTATGPAAAARKEGVGGLSFLSEDMHTVT